MASPIPHSHVSSIFWALWFGKNQRSTLVLSILLFLLEERMLACGDRCSQKSSCRASPGAGFNCHHFSIGPPCSNFQAIGPLLGRWTLFIRFSPLDTSTTLHLRSVFASPRAFCLPPIFISANSAHIWSSYAVLDHSSGDRDIVPTYVPKDIQSAPFGGGDKLFVTFYGINGDVANFEVPA